MRLGIDILQRMLFLSSSIDYESDAEVVGSGGDIKGVDGAANVELHAGSKRCA